MSGRIASGDTPAATQTEAELGNNLDTSESTKAADEPGALLGMKSRCAIFSGADAHESRGLISRISQALAARRPSRLRVS